MLTEYGVRIGRHRDCDVVFADPTVSGCHAEIRLDEHGRYVITDLGSLTGVYVNQCPVDGATELHDEDVIWIGKARLTYCAGQGSAGQVSESL